MRGILVVSLLMLAAVAGCVGNETSDGKSANVSKMEGKKFRTLQEIKEQAREDISKLMEGVPCEVPSVGAETTKNLKVLGNITFETGGSQEIDIRGDWILMARGGGFALWNISDPLRPYEYSNYDETRQNADVKFSPDNMTALVGAGWGIDLVDIRDPFHPVRAGQWRFDSVSSPPSGGLFQNAHMIFTAGIAGQQWVFVAPNSNTGVWILKLVGPPEKRSLEFVTQTLRVQGGPLGPHDMWVTFDNDVKKWLLYSADGFHGWTVFDVSNPAMPTPVGGLVRPETGYTHTIQAAKIGNRRIVATIQEVGVNVMEVYDATQLAAPILLATWQVGPASAAPQHNFNIVGGKLYLAHYNYGAYVFDLTKLGPAFTPMFGPMGHYAAAGTPSGGFGQFWEVALKDGIVYAPSYSGGSRGVHIIGFGCNKAGDPLLTSTG